MESGWLNDCCWRADTCDLTTPNLQRLRILNSETLVELYLIPDTGCGIADVSWSPNSDAIADTSVGLRVWDLNIQDNSERTSPENLV